MFPKDSADQPGPGEHQSVEKRDATQTQGALKGESGSFRSTQDRIPRDPTRDKCQKPEPGTYEPFDKVNYRSPFRRPKNDHLSFGSSASRWNPNETFVGQKFAANPGPGEYDPALAVGNIPGGAKTTTQRGAGEVKHQGLGPGVYNVHGSTMHRMTYNVSGPEHARKAQGVLRDAEPPNIDGGSGGGIAGTRSRLGQCAGGSGANQLAADEALWNQDRQLQEQRATLARNDSKNSIRKDTKNAWQPPQDGAGQAKPVTMSATAFTVSQSPTSAAAPAASVAAASPSVEAKQPDSAAAAAVEVAASPAAAADSKAPEEAVGEVAGAVA